MPRSMTAFARNTIEYPWGSVICEIRSVNHRYLETSFRLPETIRELEMQFREIARKKLNRGKIDISIRLAYNNSDTDISTDMALAKHYVAIAESLAREMADPAKISPLDIMRWPGVLKEQEVDSKELQTSVLNAFNQTVEQLLEGRLREGDKLAELIEERLTGILTQVSLVREQLPEILQQQRTRLNEKLAELKSQVDEERLEQEMVIIANRTDVDEELDRLETHVTEIRRVLQDRSAIGRRLDFLMQELNREANTLGSKSISSITTQISVELKVLIEQMREQIQNIE